MNGNTIPTDRRRYILYNVALWMGVLVVAVAAIGVVHRYSEAILNRRHASDLLERASATYEAGNLEQSQALTLQVMRASPDFAAAAVDELGQRLLGMPLVLAQLGTIAETENWVETQPETAAKFALLQGRAGDAVQLLSRDEQRRGANGETHWMLGQLHLTEADFSKAQANFEAYWAAHPEEQPAVAKTLTAALATRRPDVGASSAMQLFHHGLWPQAFHLANIAAELTDETIPALQFLAAVELDVAGKRDDAMAAYRAVLATQPQHLLAQKRLARLER